MNELIQAGEFYASLTSEEKKDLADAIASDIFFLDEDLQLKVLELFKQVAPELKENIEKINDFTT